MARPVSSFGVASWDVTLAEDECWNRLSEARHGVLATGHPVRGVDLVPVVFALVNRDIILPVDAVKTKRHARLQRLANLALDPRCCFMVDHFSDDWSQLWWVRVHGHAVEAEVTDEALVRLADRYAQYRPAHTVTAMIRLAPSAVVGWAAA